MFYDSDTSNQLDLIQETYDLKGSVVGRSAQPLKPGTHAICRYCREEFIVGEKNTVSPQPGDFAQLIADYENRTGDWFAYNCANIVFFLALHKMAPIKIIIVDL